ncbi:MAG: septum formation initiator family protein [Rhodospirillaceae bacterium]|nr:septum formation initiator family protein [Rhodospirillaceae bacterium]
MALARNLGTRLQPALLPVIGLVLFGYFVFHSIQGERGLVAWLVLKQEIRAAQARETALSGEAATLERRVALLSPDSLDPDMVEERARLMLNYAHSDELVIMLGRPDSSGYSNVDLDRE